MKTFEVPIHYRSSLITAIKKSRRLADKLKKDFVPTVLDLEKVQIIIARHFGFCYGVENAIEIAFKAISENKDKRIFLLSEMIHNPQVNADLQSEGVRFIMDTNGHQLISWDEVNSDDIVIVPAFGTSLEIEQVMKSKGIEPSKYNTTCPFVEKVWNRSEKIGKDGYTIIVHGKPKHEETKATFSHSQSITATVVVRDMDQTKRLAKYITKELPKEDFYEEFKGQYSEGFNVDIDLQKIGIVNQTTMLASDTQAIADYLKQVMTDYYHLNIITLKDHFADTRDTLCYATNDNQTAVSEMLNVPADMAIVIGGYNSSNTSHLVELCEEKLPTYFIKNEDCLIDANTIKHYNLKTKTEEITVLKTTDVQPLKIMVTSGASCPDALVENVIVKLCSLMNLDKKLDDIVKQFA